MAFDNRGGQTGVVVAQDAETKPKEFPITGEALVDFYQVFVSPLNRFVVAWTTGVEMSKNVV